MREIVVYSSFALCVAMGGIIFRNSIGMYLLSVFLGTYMIEIMKGDE